MRWTLFNEIIVMSWDTVRGNKLRSALTMLGILIGVALLGSTIALAVGTARNPMRRGWAMGIWLGIGMAALLEGLCFGGMMF